MGDTEVPVCVFLLFPQAHTYCISVTVARQQRDNMSQQTGIWHRREILLLGCHVMTATTALYLEVGFHRYWAVHMQVTR